MDKCLKKIEVNNQRYLELQPQDNGIQVVTLGANGDVENTYVVSDGEIVMLLNYYRNCKSGLEKSDYILPHDCPVKKGICDIVLIDDSDDLKIKKLEQRVKEHYEKSAYSSLTMVCDGKTDLSALTCLCDDIEDYGTLRRCENFDKEKASELTKMLAEQCDKMSFIIVNSLKVLDTDFEAQMPEYSCRSDKEKEKSISEWIERFEDKNLRLRPIVSWLESSGMNIWDAERMCKEEN